MVGIVVVVAEAVLVDVVGSDDEAVVDPIVVVVRVSAGPQALSAIKTARATKQRLIDGSP